MNERFRVYTHSRKINCPYSAMVRYKISHAFFEVTYIRKRSCNDQGKSKISPYPYRWFWDFTCATW